MSDTLPATEAEIDLDPELHRLATLRAVHEWNHLPAARQADTPFDALVERHRERLARGRTAARN